MLAPVLHESFLTDAFAGREGQTTLFIGRAHAAPAFATTTLFGLQGRPSIILIGAGEPDSDGLSSVRFSVMISDNLSVLISDFSFPTVRFSLSDFLQHTPAMLLAPSGLGALN